MTLHHIFDAAFPPKTVPAGCSGVLGYIGGANAPFANTQVDYSVVDEWLFSRGGQGPRH